jgi:MGT family glycosyltransferase
LSRILAYTSPAHGHLFPAAAVLRELSRRGHEVALRTLAGEVETMRSLGFEARPIAAEIESLKMDDWRARGRIGRLSQSVRRFCSRAPYEVDDLRRAIGEERPDTLLVDGLTWGAMSAAEAWGGPWAVFAPTFLPLGSRGGPPSGPGLRPLPGVLGRSRDRLARAVLRAATDRLPGGPIAELRASLGLAPLEHCEDIFLAPPLLLNMTAEPFEYPRPDWPESIVMVGPCAWEPSAELPPELADVEAPLLLVNTSTEFQDDGHLVEVALEALAEEPVHVVATMPSASAAGLAPSPNASILRFAPHGPILDRAVCAITHGGMGATQKALARGVPVCVAAVGRDQFEVARRVEVTGSGTGLSARRLRAARLRGKVREAISRRAGAERVAAAFAAAGGAPAAAEAFEARVLGA